MIRPFPRRRNSSGGLFSILSALQKVTKETANTPVCWQMAGWSFAVGVLFRRRTDKWMNLPFRSVRWMRFLLTNTALCSAGFSYCNNATPVLLYWLYKQWKLIKISFGKHIPKSLSVCCITVCHFGNYNAVNFTGPISTIF